MGMYVSEILTPLHYAYNKGFDSKQMKVYVMMLSDIPEPLLQQAVHELICTSKFLPSIAEIREKCYDIYSQGKGVDPLTADELMAIFKRRANGYITAAEAFKDRPDLAKVAREFGWKRFCNTTMEEEAFVKKELYGMYMSVKAKEKADNMKDFSKLDYSGVKLIEA